MHKVNYDLLGSIPVMDAFSDSLPGMLTRLKELQVMAAVSRAAFKDVFNRSGAEGLLKYLSERSKTPEAQELMALGVTIEMCAQHFYGIDTTELGGINEVVAALEAAIDNEAHGA